MSDLQQLYQTIILEHSKARHGSGDLTPLADAVALGSASGLRVAESHQINTSCGDEVTLRVSLRSGDGADSVAELVWTGDGCSISQASASILTDVLQGLSATEARALLDNFREMLRSRGKIEPDEEILGDAAAFGGVSRYPARVKCAMLPWVAFEAALIEAESH
ncbi:SUF system NifU family Fe-S cluster assembly protein [Cryobacterium sp. TMT1-3]|uniref:SUF system NifU family Fe-S cluster assembly protein n=1 Tax=Cryobacterium luteum TaxID=1424661 RepID=A0A1H8GYK3_9MICO|nr:MULTISPECIES: SUF system NifU family Fe-S cluster assembly protein [Cryobacterium]TFB84555.1 SUF system NifU family Fe-S cluster assembly protein [Cryobacterium luteum]TFC28497.1 SUF system NifU family Fe-S cluster assembly protein [Cryobacterium sp. TMT1-3]SEN48955.1 nitrogen fixation protein NifU [Cryobacterium luteum]